MTLLLATLLFSACYWWGTRLEKGLGWNESLSAEGWLFATALGLASAGYLMFLLALLGLSHPVAGWVLLGLFLLSGAHRIGRDLSRLWRQLRRLAGDRRPWVGAGGLNLFCLGVLGLLIFLGLTLALTPPAKQDALVYHLAVPKAYLEAGEAVNLPNNKYSYQPMLTQMVYLWAMALQFEPLPQVTGFGMTLLLCAGLTLYYRHRCRGRWPLLPAALFLSVPTFWEISAQAYVDTQTALWAFLAFYAWDRWQEKEAPRWFGRMALFAALAVASKLTLFLAVPLVFLAIAWQGRRHRPRWVLARVALFALLFALVLAPWWARNLHYTGNPFTPWFMDRLGGADRINWDGLREYQERLLVRNTGTGRSLKDFLMLPYSLTFLSRPGGFPFDGQIGVVYFLLLPAWVFLPWRERGPPGRRCRALALAAFLFLLVWFLYFPGIRYLAPVFTLLSVGSAWGLSRLTDSGLFQPEWLKRGLSLVVAGGLLFNLGLIGAEWSRLGPLDYLAGREDRDAYLTRRVLPYPVYRAMNRHLGPGDKALFVFMRNYGYLCKRPFIADSFFEAHTLQNLVRRHRTPAELAAALQRRGITHLMFDENFLFGPEAAFTRSEQRLIAGLLWWTGRWVAGERGFYLYRIVLD